MRAVRDFSLSLPEAVEIIANEALVAQPGARFNYGGANYQVAARIAEIITGAPFDQYMTENLLMPLKMRDTYFKPRAEDDPKQVAVPYRFDKEKGLVPIAAYLPDANRRLVLASGGLYSSLNDLAVFLQMHLNEGAYGGVRILAPRTVAQMQADQTGAAKAEYGLGWFLDSAKEDGQAMGVHRGGVSAPLPGSTGIEA